MDYSEIAQRVSAIFSKQGIEVDLKKIDGKLHTLIDEFGVQPKEAERSLTNALAKEHGLTLNAHGGAVNPDGPAETIKISECNPDDWVSIRGKVISVSKPPVESMAQSGTIADASGAIGFVVWAKANAPLMEAGKWYEIGSAVCDEYKGVLGIKIHSGTTITPVETEEALIPTIIPIAELHPGCGYSIRAKVTQEWDASHANMLQSGMMGDETGQIKFVTWKSPDAISLRVGAVYNIFYATVSDYMGKLSMNLNGASIAQDDGDIEVKAGGGAGIEGSLVHLAPGSGCIKRCPVEGCNRTLSRQNFCQVHEIQPNHVYDLRIKGWLDDGIKTHNILMKRGAVEALTGMTLEQAIQISENNPLGAEEVFIRMREKLLGRYYVCTGSQFEDRFIVETCELKVIHSEDHIALLNRAGAVS